tara:strand:+ start:3248 stop:3604 length:357 start_codon:yes stop_codon:yes gene_type:complete
MGQQVDANVEKLTGILGFDGGKKPSLTQTVLNEVLTELQDERAVTAKKEAKELLLKAIDLQGQMKKAEKDFERQSKKFNKELGKILNMIDNQLKGIQTENDGGDSNESSEESSEQDKS